MPMHDPYVLVFLHHTSLYAFQYHSIFMVRKKKWSSCTNVPLWAKLSSSARQLAVPNRIIYWIQVFTLVYSYFCLYIWCIIHVFAYTFLIFYSFIVEIPLNYTSLRNARVLKWIPSYKEHILIHPYYQ